MMTSTRKSPAQPVDADAPPHSRPGTAAARSVRIAGVTAGIGILLMAVLAGFGNFAAVEGLVTPGDPARTAGAIASSEGLFRLGIASLILVVALDVVVAWALYRVFAPVNRSLSLLAAWFRLVYAAVFLVAIGHLVDVLHLLGDGSYLAVFTAEQLQAHVLLAITAFGNVWAIGLLLFGIHLIVIGYLAYRSGHVPRVLGVLLVVAGVGYMIDTLAAVLFRGPWTDVSTFTFVGEFLLALWLLVRRGRPTLHGRS